MITCQNSIKKRDLFGHIIQLNFDRQGSSHNTVIGGATSIIIYTFMAFFIARLGATPVAGHQIAVNLIAMMFMIALALATAAGTLGAGARRATVPSRRRLVRSLPS